MEFSTVYFPLGAIGIVRWSIWIIKKTVSFRYKPVVLRKNSFKLSIVTAVYNEDANIFKQALNSWKRNKPEEIIAVIDYSDLSSIGIFREFSKKFKEAKLIITEKPGKRPALVDGIKATNYEIIALVDSDTIWDHDVSSKALASFKDPEIGGVSVRQEVLNPDTLARKLFNIQLTERYFTEFPFLSVVGNVFNCLSGRTAIYRSKALKNVLDKMLSEKFMGKSCISGEDKALTNLVQSAGWKSSYVKNTSVKTPGSPDIFTFLRQRTRWSRNSWRADLKMIFSKWIWQREKILALYTLDRFIQPFIFLLAPISFVFAVFLGHWLIVFFIFSWWLVSRTVKIYSHFKRYPRDFLILPLYIFFSYVSDVIKIYALFTVSRQGWITRWDKSRLEKGLTLVRSIPAYFATGAVIFSVSFLIFPGFNLEKREEVSRGFDMVKTELSKNEFKYYTAKENDTLENIAAFYNVELASILKFNSYSGFLFPGQQIKILLADLIKIPEEYIFGQKAEIRYDQSANTVILRNGFATILDIYSEAGKKVLEPRGEEWLLKANVSVGQGGVLIIEKEKINFNSVWVKLKNSRLGIYGSELKGSGFLEVSGNSRLDVFDSEISFSENRCSISLKAGKNNLLAGTVTKSKISNGGAAFCSFGASAFSISSNEIYDNEKNGIILDDYSHNFLIANNYIYNNGGDGISLESSSNNEVYSNNIFKNHNGIVFFESEKNIISSNNIFENGGGIIMNNSGKNLIKENYITNNNCGVKINGINPTDYLELNEISFNRVGVVIYGGFINNLKVENSISKNDSDIHFKK